MAFTTTSNYAGKAAGFYISAALNQANSLEYLTMMENIKFKSNIQKMAGSGLVQNATCDFTDAGTLALTENVLTPKNLQINLDLCKSTLLDSWEALQMRAGAGAPPPASFDDYVISYMGEIIANGVEASVWSGAAATAGQFEGFLTGTTGIFAVDGTVNTSTASAAYTADNIIANLQTLTADMATDISAVLRKEDLHIFMSPKTYALYVSAVSTLGYVNAYNMNGDYAPVFEGYKIAVCNGMPDNQLVAAEKSNLFFGTDLLSDQTRISLMDMAALDGSDNMRLVARYSGGVQIGIGADIVHQS
ncbi:MAG: phage major capsid protein [Gammaproteobacteria bacterium]|nr:phage major capsid protein [Gammaproteobacteria bacterium]